VPLLIILEAGVATGQSVPADTFDLAAGPCAEMQILLQKTTVKVDVFSLRVRFDEETATRFGALATGRRGHSSLEDSIAKIALESRATRSASSISSVSISSWEAASATPAGCASTCRGIGWRSWPI
jgi:hypothetical protein